MTCDTIPDVTHPDDSEGRLENAPEPRSDRTLFREVCVITRYPNNEVAVCYLYWKGFVGWFQAQGVVPA